jgi:hypothetical protein
LSRFVCVCRPAFMQLARTRRKRRRTASV